MKVTTTQQDILTSIASKSTEIFGNSAKMYSNSHCKKKENKKENTFQQSTDPMGPTNENVRGQAPSLPPGASHPLVREDQEKKYGRRLNWQNDLITEIRLQIGNVRIGTRHKRAGAYISIKTDTDTRYMIFMKASLTTALDEIYRGIKRDNDKVLQTITDDMVNEFPKENLFLGRIRYKVTKGQKIQKYHRQNLPLTMLAMYIENGEFKARLYLVDEEYDFVLSDDLTPTQKKFYEYEGLWERDPGTMSINDAFGE